MKKKHFILIACDTTSIKKVKKIITESKTHKIKIDYKFGLEFMNSKKGRGFISNLKNKITMGDYKISDIPNTCASTIKAVKDLKFNYLTIHLSSGLEALRAAKKVAGKTKLIGVSLLTSLDNKDLKINPTGRFVIGGPDGDAGLTGRKIIVDTYGGAAPHGGGAFSGKDPSKVDRSAAYMARYIAKNIVHAKIAKKCQIQISYAIGLSYPMSFYLKLDKSANIDTKKLSDAIMRIVDLSPKGIVDHLSLKNPIYAKTSCYGHFGRSPNQDGSFSWEKLDLAEKLLSELS